MVNIFRLGLLNHLLAEWKRKSKPFELPTGGSYNKYLNRILRGSKDLGEVEWARREDVTDISRFLRYIVPDDRHSIPHRKIAEHLLQGDVVIVDLRMLAHMEAQKGACRRRLLEIAQEQGLNAFVLDVDEDLILIPGTGVAVDVDRHVLGLESEPI